MSADNFYVIRFHPAGGYAAVMGFSSDDNEVREARMSDRHFNDIDDALDWANEQYSEYGVSLHAEVRAQQELETRANGWVSKSDPRIIGLSDDQLASLRRAAERDTEFADAFKVVLASNG